MFVNVVAASLGASQSQRDGLSWLANPPEFCYGALVLMAELRLKLNPSSKVPNPKNLWIPWCQSKMSPFSLTNETLVKRHQLRAGTCGGNIIFPLSDHLRITSQMDLIKSQNNEILTLFVCLFSLKYFLMNDETKKWKSMLKNWKQTTLSYSYDR